MFNGYGTHLSVGGFGITDKPGNISNWYDYYSNVDGFVNNYGIYLDGNKNSGAIVIDTNGVNGSIYLGENQEVNLFYNDTNLSLQTSGNFRVEGDLMYGGALVSFSPQIFCGIGSDNCFAIDPVTKTSTWCSLSSASCETKNIEIENKLRKIKDERTIREEFNTLAIACNDETNSYVSLTDYKNGARGCLPDQRKINDIYQKELAIAKKSCEIDKYHIYNEETEECDYNKELECYEKDDWSYFDGSKCLVNPFRECILNQPLKTWNFEKNKCEKDSSKECNAEPDKIWDSKTSNCIFNADKDKQTKMKDCLNDRSKIWDGSNCLSALGVSP